MYLETLRGITGVGVFPALSLLVFVIVFATMLVRVVRMDRASIRAFADLPLDPETTARAEQQERKR